MWGYTGVASHKKMGEPPLYETQGTLTWNYRFLSSAVTALATDQDPTPINNNTMIKTRILIIIILNSIVKENDSTNRKSLCNTI